MAPKHKSEPERKEQILKAASICIAKKGYEATRLDDIVKEAGLSKGAIYYYFDSKLDILLSLIDYWIQLFAAEYAKILALNLPFLETVDRVGQVSFKMIDENQGLTWAQFEMWAGAFREPAFADKLRQLGEQYMGEFARMIEQGIERGELRPGLDPEGVAIMLAALLDGLSLYSLQQAQWFNAERHWPTVMKVIRAGLANPAYQPEKEE